MKQLKNETAIITIEKIIIIFAIKKAKPEKELVSTLFPLRYR